MAPQGDLPQTLLEKPLSDLTDSEVKLIMDDFKQRTTHHKKAVYEDLKTTRVYLRKLAKDIGITDENLLRKLK